MAALLRWFCVHVNESGSCHGCLLYIFSVSVACGNHLVILASVLPLWTSQACRWLPGLGLSRVSLMCRSVNVGRGCVIVPTPALRNIFCKPLAYATHWPNGSNVGSRTPLWQMEFQLFSIELWRGLASVAARGGLTRFSLPMHVYGYKRRLSCLILLVDACPRGATAGSSQQLRRRRPEACNSSCQH